MSMKKVIPLSLTTIVLLAVGAAAQTANPPDVATRVQHRVSFLTTVLSLTPAQQQQATTIFTTAANTNEGVQNQFKAAHDAIITAVRNNDSGGIDQASTTIGNLVAQITASEGKANAAFYQILTPDQQAKANQLVAQMRDHFGHPWGGPPPVK